MNIKKIMFYLIVLSLIINCFPLSAQVKYDAYKLSGPYTHENLTIFLIHGEDQLKNKKLITLTEALQQKKIKVYETGDVNELAVKNISRDTYIFIQSGDIVKGGKQDRTIQYDQIIPPKSEKIPVNSFCVEQGRWQPRGSEKADEFHSSEKKLSSKELKLAAKDEASQQKVWSEVSKIQDKLSNNVGGSVKNKDSESSLQLTLENKNIDKKSKEYVNALSKITRNKNDIIGYVFAINGEINSADIYAQNKLFNKLWKNMLEASAVEAIAEYDKNKNVKKITQADVQGWFKDLQKGKKARKTINQHAEMDVRESEENVSYETYEKDDDKWIHKNFIKK